MELSFLTFEDMPAVVSSVMPTVMSSFMPTVMPAIRVRELIKKVPFDAIGECGLPNLDTPKGKRDGIVWTSGGKEPENSGAPSWVNRTKSWSRFGLFMDLVTRQMLCEICEKRGMDCTPAKMYGQGWETCLYSMAQECYEGVTKFLPKESTLIESFDFDGYYGWLEEIIPDVKVSLAPEYNLYDDPAITSHPDLVIGHNVIDIKTTQNFSKMRKEALLQVVSYYVIMRMLGQDVERVGFLLPLQRKLLLVDVPEEFNCLSFYEEMKKGAMTVNGKKAEVIESQINAVLSGTFPKQEISFGCHIAKIKGKITASLNNFLSGPLGKSKECQMFLSSSQNRKRGKFDPKDLVSAKELIQREKIAYFTHTPYIINLCSDFYHSLECKLSDEELEKSAQGDLHLTKRDLILTSQIGGRGVVIHTGKPKKTDKTKAIETMKQNIRSLLKYATEQCPLLLETGAGQGTELFCDPRELAEFYMTFSKEERSLFKVCVDTCHVFAAGCEPDEYLSLFEKLTEEDSVRLIHFNNSKFEKGCCKDRHCPVFQGEISVERMRNVSEWARARGIALVFE